jgi:hypothetical protein
MRQGREADNSPPSTAEVKELVELYVHSPNTPSGRGAQLKHRDNFTYIDINRIIFTEARGDPVAFKTPTYSS